MPVYLYDPGLKIYAIDQADHLYTLAAFFPNKKVRVMSTAHTAESGFVADGYKKVDPEEILPEAEILTAVENRNQFLAEQNANIVASSPRVRVIAGDPSPFRADPQPPAYLEVPSEPDFEVG